MRPTVGGRLFLDNDGEDEVTPVNRDVRTYPPFSIHIFHPFEASEAPPAVLAHPAVMFLSMLITPYALLALPLLYYLLPYFRKWSLRNIPAPFPAAFSNLWLMHQCRRGRRYQAVDDAHKRLGPVVRIQPNHISIADPDAIQIIYGHGNGLTKR